MVFLGSLRELCLEKKELGLLLQNHFEYLIMIKPVDGLLNRFEESPSFQLIKPHSGSFFRLSDHRDALKVKSRIHPMAEEDEMNEEVYIIESFFFLCRIYQILQ